VTFSTIALSVVGVSILGSLVRVIIGPTIWDRILAVGLAASKVTLAVILLAITVPETDLLDLALLFSVLGFLVTVLMARFVERRGVL
jgi:multicomponent Na+:H+ antiporter subunit F